MNSFGQKQALREPKKPDGALNAFYIETPLAPGNKFYDYLRSKTFQRFKKEEQDLILAKKHPLAPSATAETEVITGPVGNQVREEAYVCETDEDGAITLPLEEERFAQWIFVALRNRYGSFEVRLHPKSLDWTTEPEGLRDRVAEQQQNKDERLATSAAKANALG